MQGQFNFDQGFLFKQQSFQFVFFKEEHTSQPFCNKCDNILCFYFKVIQESVQIYSFITSNIYCSDLFQTLSLTLLNIFYYGDMFTMFFTTQQSSYSIQIIYASSFILKQSYSSYTYFHSDIQIYLSLLSIYLLLNYFNLYTYYSDNLQNLNYIVPIWHLISLLTTQQVYKTGLLLLIAKLDFPHWLLIFTFQAAFTSVHIFLLLNKRRKLLVIHWGSKFSMSCCGYGVVNPLFASLEQIFLSNLCLIDLCSLKNGIRMSVFCFFICFFNLFPLFSSFTMIPLYSILFVSLMFLRLLMFRNILFLIDYINLTILTPPFCLSFIIHLLLIVMKLGRDILFIKGERRNGHRGAISSLDDYQHGDKNRHNYNQNILKLLLLIRKKEERHTNLVNNIRRKIGHPRNKLNDQRKANSMGKRQKQKEKQQEFDKLSYDGIIKNKKFKLPKLVYCSHFPSQTINKQHIQSKLIYKKQSKNQEIINQKKILEPLHVEKFQCAVQTKAGCVATQIKTNQDAYIIDQKLPNNIKMYCICDGHGLNGHLVSGFIKKHLLKILIKNLKKQKDLDSNIKHTIQVSFNTCNQDLLNSDINTDLSGSTVVAGCICLLVFLYKNRIICANVGDSRAIIISKHNQQWSCSQLSIDQKPERKDQKQRVLKNGGRIDCQKNQNGNCIGPLRVWLQKFQMPGLAMTRSFGDKIGLQAGTSGQPQILQYPLQQQNKIIVVASDGVWQYVQNQQVKNLIVPFFQKRNIFLGCEKLLSYSIAAWRRQSLARDDITAIVVAIKPF